MRFRITDHINHHSIRQFVQGDPAIATGLFVIMLFTRIPFASRMIFEGDSARFAMALKQYDVAQLRPHPPGYILYVALAKFVELFTNDILLSLVSVSIASSALTIFIFYFLAKKMYGRSSAIISALLLISSPLYWFNGEMPLTYALEGLLSVIFGLICFKIITAEKKWLYASAIVLGLATGVRQNAILFFLPLWLYAIRKSSVKQILLSFVIFGVTCLTWVTPMVVMTGGIERYYTAVTAQYTTWVLHPATFLFQIVGRWKVFSSLVIYSFYLGLVPLIYYFGRLFMIPAIVEDIRLRFILFWFVPAALFFIGVNVFNPGHIVVILPPLSLCVAESVKGMAGDFAEAIKTFFSKKSTRSGKLFVIIFSRRAMATYSICVIILLNVYIFLFKATPVSHATIRNGDQNLSELIRLTKKHFNPEKTIILTFIYNTQAALYLPNYLIYCPFPLMFKSSTVPIEAQNVYVSHRFQTTPKTYWTPTGFKIEPIIVPDGIEKIVLWEKEISQYYMASDRPLQELKNVPADKKIYFFGIKPGEKIFYDYHYLSIRPKN